LSPGLISTTDALVKSTDLIRPGVKLPKDWISESQDNGGTASLTEQDKRRRRCRSNVN